jgi:hypothetical protein
MQLQQRKGAMGGERCPTLQVRIRRPDPDDWRSPAPHRHLPTPGNPVAGIAAAALPLIGAVLVLAAFVIIETRSTAPLLPPRLVRIRGLAAADTAALTVLAAPIGVSFIVTLNLQDVQQHSPMRTALTLLPGGVLSALVGRYIPPARWTGSGCGPSTQPVWPSSPGATRCWWCSVRGGRSS